MTGWVRWVVAVIAVRAIVALLAWARNDPASAGDSRIRRDVRAALVRGPRCLLTPDAAAAAPSVERGRAA